MSDVSSEMRLPTVTNGATPRQSCHVWRLCSGRNGADGEQIHQIVHRIAAVTLDPLEIGPFVFSMSEVQLDHLVPEICIGHGFALGIAPAIRLPLHPPPVSKAIDDIGRVAHDDQSPHLSASDRSVHSNSFDGGRQLHPLIRRAGGSAARARFAGWCHRPSPTPRSGISAARSIGVDDAGGIEMANRRCIHERIMIAHPSIRCRDTHRTRISPRHTWR